MKSIQIIVIIATVLLFGCGERQTFELHIGEQSKLLPVASDPKDIQDGIIAELRLERERVNEGDSSLFYYRSSSPLKTGGVTSTWTTTSPKWRFFKNRDGMNGFEQIDDSKEGHLISNHKAAGWKEIESRLRESILSEKSIQQGIMHSHGEQGGSADADQ